MFKKFTILLLYCFVAICKEFSVFLFSLLSTVNLLLSSILDPTGFILHRIQENNEKTAMFALKLDRLYFQ